MTGLWPFAPVFVLLAMTWKNGGVSARRIPMWLFYLARFVVFEPLRLVERLAVDRRIRSHALPSAPIFVLGHWRSGTSHLQTLLYLDPRFTTSTIYRSLFSDVFYLTEGWLKPVFNAGARAVGARYDIQRVALDLDLPAEGDLGLCSLCSPYSYTWGHVFPSRFSQWVERLVLSPSDADRDGWLAAYDYFIRKLSLASGGKRVVIKSPGDTARLSMLAERYPDAKFVTIRRRPEEVFYSNRYLWSVVLQDHGVQWLDEAQIDTLILDNYAALMARYEEQRAALPPQRLVEIRYADLRDDPIRALSRVYAQLDLGDLPTDQLQDHLQRQPTYTAPAYTLSPEVAARLQEAWGPLPGSAGPGPQLP